MEPAVYASIADAMNHGRCNNRGPALERFRTGNLLTGKYGLGAVS